MAKLEEKEKTK